MADSLTALKAAMQQGWRPGGIQEEPEPSPEPDTWWGGFTQQLGRELNLPGMIDQATIRPRETRADTLAQFAPYLGTPAPGTTPASALIKNLLGRTVPAAVQRAASAAPAVEDTVQVMRPPTGPPAAPGFSVGPSMSLDEMDALVAARRAAKAAKPPVTDPNFALSEHAVDINAPVREFNVASDASKPADLGGNIGRPMSWKEIAADQARRAAERAAKRGK